MGYKSILVPLDGSETARNAVEHAERLACEDKAGIVLLGVVETPAMQLEGYGEMLGTLDIQERLRKRYEEVLEKEASLLREKGFQVKWIIREGLAHEEINAACLEEKCDVLVMTTHGRTGIAHFIMGSVAERVIRSAPCPVLIVRGPQNEEAE